MEYRSRKINNSGYALLISIVTISIVLAIGLTILNVSLKQLSLSSTNRDSEVAIHAAIAGSECLEYYRLSDFWDGGYNFQGTSPTSISCLGSTIMSENHPPSEPVSGGIVYKHEYEFTWSTANSLCSDVDLYILDATTQAGDISNYSNISYTNIEKDCADGNVCRVIVSSGYNRACNDRGGIRTVERQIVIQ